MGDDSTTGECSPAVPWISAEDLADGNTKFHFTRSTSVLPQCAQEAIFKTRKRARNTLLVATDPTFLNQWESLEQSSKGLKKEDAVRFVSIASCIHFSCFSVLCGPSELPSTWLKKLRLLFTLSPRTSLTNS